MPTDAPAQRRLGVLAHQLQPHAASEAAPDALRHGASAAPAVLIGGIVMDVQARPEAGGAKLQAGGSVPGTVTHTAGGVARNIAVGLAQRLGPGAPPPLLVSCVGRDAAGGALTADLAAQGLPLRGVLRPPGAATATVSIVFDGSGEVAAAVADVSALERALTPAALASEFSHDIAAAPLVVVDTNLSAAALQGVCKAAAAAGVPMWLEPVSAPKAVSVLQHLTFVSPNAAELVAMAQAASAAQQRRPNQNVTSSQPPPPPPLPQQQHLQQPQQQVSGSMQASRQREGAESGGEARGLLRRLAPHMAILLQAGVQHVVLTLGAAGAALATLERETDSSGSGGGAMPSGGRCTVRITHMPAEPAVVVSTSGAGDCLVAGTAAALLWGRTPEEAIAHGMAAAHASVQSRQNVPHRCDAAAERQRASCIYAARQTWVEVVESAVSVL